MPSVIGIKKTEFNTRLIIYTSIACSFVCIFAVYA